MIFRDFFHSLGILLIVSTTHRNKSDHSANVEMNCSLKHTMFWVIGWPRKNEPEETTIAALKRLESWGTFLQVFKRGYSQGATIDPHYQVKVLIIFAMISINVLRGVLLLTLEDERWLAFLGDYFYNLPNREVTYILSLVGLFLLCSLRQYTLHLEDCQCFLIFRTLENVKELGFRKEILKMTHNQCQKFRWYLHLIIKLWLRIITFSGLVVLFLTNYIYLSNKWTYEVENLLAFDIVWSIPTCLIFLLLLSGNFFVGTTIMIFICYFRCRLDSMLEHSKRYAQQMDNVDDDSVGRLIHEKINYLNELENTTKNLRYYFFFIYFFISFGADICFFLGAIVQIHSFIESSLLVTISLFTFVLMSVGSYFAGDFIHKVSIGMKSSSLV